MLLGPNPKVAASFTQDMHCNEDLGLKQWKSVSRSELEVAEHGALGLLEGAVKVMARKRGN